MSLNEDRFKVIRRIRPTEEADLPRVMVMYAIDRSYMRQTGNASQWGTDYPPESLIREEIAAGHSFGCENDAGKPVGTFCFIIGEDPTYHEIFGGEWLDEGEEYGTVHRIASSGEEKGVGDACIRWCLARHPNIRVDTHRDNRAMQHIIEKLGFSYRGIIHVEDGSERLAYQKSTKG